MPYPPDHATRIRAWNLLRRMADTHEVTLLTWDPFGDADAVAAVRDRVHRLAVEPLADAPMSLGHRARRWAGAVAGDLPPWIQALRAERDHPASVTRALADAGPFDVVVAEDDAAAFLLPAVDAPVVVHRHNVYANTMRQLRRGPRRLLWPVEGAVWRRLDRATRFAALQVAPTDACARALSAAMPEAAVGVVPNGVDVPPRAARPARGRDVVLLGTMDYAPNAEGAEWFIRQVWSRVRGSHTDSTLLVVGRGAIERLGHLGGDGVRIVGYVDDLASVCAGARAGVVPLHAGLGIKTKTLDLMAMGLPVVATPVGAEGIDAGPVVAADAPSFADAVGQLLADPARAEQLGGAGRGHVAERFSWDVAASIYERLLGEVALTGEAVAR